jgi:hypothetical protein
VSLLLLDPIRGYQFGVMAWDPVRAAAAACGAIVRLVIAVASVRGVYLPVVFCAAGFCGAADFSPDGINNGFQVSLAPFASAGFTSFVDR